MEQLPVLRPFASCNDEDERVAVGLGPSCCTSIALVQGALEQRLQGFPIEGMPGSQSFPSVALISDQYSVALAANLATAAGAMYLKLSLKPVCVVIWMAEYGVQRSLASTMSSAPAGPTTFCHGLSDADNLLRELLRAV